MTFTFSRLMAAALSSALLFGVGCLHVYGEDMVERARNAFSICTELPDVQEMMDPTRRPTLLTALAIPCTWALHEIGVSRKIYQTSGLRS